MIRFNGILFATLLIACLSCSKQEVGSSPLEGEWEIVAIEDNLGVVIMDTPYDLNKEVGFTSKAEVIGSRYLLGICEGTLEVYEGRKCAFSKEVELTVLLEGEKLKWANKLKRLHQRVDRYEIDGDILYLKSELKRIKLRRE